MLARAKSEPLSASERRKLRHARSGAGVGQLSLVEHALCPLDPRASVFDTSYYFTDSARHQREAKASIFCPLGLSANDEFYLWGLPATTDLPTVEPHCHNREIRQVGESAGALGPQELAWSDIADDECHTHLPPPYPFHQLAGAREGLREGCR
jgi:hypothetical protein